MKKKMSIQNKILIGLGSIAGLSGLIYLGKKAFESGQTKVEEKKTLAQGGNETYAKQIRMALENKGSIGINMEAVRETVRAIPTQEDIALTRDSYYKNFHVQMATDMGTHLSPTQYKEILAILNSKPSKGKTVSMQQKYDDWAKRLKAAFDDSEAWDILPGTDEDGIKAVFIEIPTQTDFAKVGAAYTRIYGSKFMDDLDSELEFWEYSDYMDIIKSKPK